MHNDLDQLAARRTIALVLEKIINVLQHLVVPVWLYDLLYHFCSKVPYLVDGEMLDAPEWLIICRAIFFSVLIYGVLLLLKRIIVWKYEEFKNFHA